MRKTPEQAFIDEMGLHCEHAGMPKMLGRILAALLIANPPHQSSGQLMETLGTTSGSISTNTRLMLLHGLVEKVEVPGERSSFFRLTGDAFAVLARIHIDQILSLRTHAIRGIEALPADPARAARLRELSTLYTYLHERLHGALEAWEGDR